LFTTRNTKVNEKGGGCGGRKGKKPRNMETAEREGEKSIENRWRREVGEMDEERKRGRGKGKEKREREEKVIENGVKGKQDWRNSEMKTWKGVKEEGKEDRESNKAGKI
jgi:hypothetical protein